ncbi:transketolase [Pararobbsia silviterrae]|uniref:Transketolase n=2 Tax=Pararobbsia silviterrae TaxID=1792498 RepID=A0A494XIN0_9BURK|nr:transketolase [Pararobbsia silviterrae]
MINPAAARRVEAAERDSAGGGAGGAQSGARPAGTIDEICVNTIRTLAMDAVQKANSGHPGTPMGLAPVAYQLWQERLNYDPLDPAWPNRDRFVLSVGHASMLLYSLLFLAGVRATDEHDVPLDTPAVSLDEIKRFRQIDSKTPGHPEYRWTSGVETTTGPLGQGLGNSVGMAIAERWLAATYNRPDAPLFDYNVYALCGDGCMMEGVSAEAASLAGHLKLSNLCWIYDSNHVTIEGGTSLAYSDDVATRFRGYGWHVEQVADANDRASLAKALAAFDAVDDRPTLIIVTSVIGYGSPKKAGTASAHGEPLGEDQVRAAKQAYGWPEDAHFLVPDGVLEHFAQGIGARGKSARAEWHARFDAYKKQYPELGAQLDLMRTGGLPSGWEAALPVFPPDPKGLATRDSSGQVLNALAAKVPWLLGGAADLAPSTKTLLKFDGAGSFAPQTYGARNFHFGIREHAMGSIANGIALSKLRPFASTFLIFSDYMKPPIRLASIMELPVTFVFTHDSIGVGEDGPTHQPVEQLASLRAIPGMVVLRPADANEAAQAWYVTLTHTDQPVCIVLTRQALPTFDRARYASAEGVRRGAYVLADAPNGKPKVILMATGSEVSMCVDVYEKLAADGIAARVVSMPSWELFERQDTAYKDSVLPPDVTARIAVEQAAELGWDRYVGISKDARTIVMHTFGASAPLSELKKKFGFTPEAVYETAKQLVK